MKVKSHGGISKTLLANWLFGAAQAALGMMQIIQGILSPEQYVVVAMVITGIHSAAGHYIRTITTGPLE